MVSKKVISAALLAMTAGAAYAAPMDGTDALDAAARNPGQTVQDARTTVDFGQATASGGLSIIPILAGPSFLSKVPVNAAATPIFVTDAAGESRIHTVLGGGGAVPTGSAGIVTVGSDGAGGPTLTGDGPVAAMPNAMATSAGGSDDTAIPNVPEATNNVQVKTFSTAFSTAKTIAQTYTIGNGGNVAVPTGLTIANTYTIANGAGGNIAVPTLPTNIPLPSQILNGNSQVNAQQLANALRIAQQLISRLTQLSQSQRTTTTYKTSQNQQTTNQDQSGTNDGQSGNSDGQSGNNDGQSGSDNSPGSGKSTSQSTSISQSGDNQAAEKQTDSTNNGKASTSTTANTEDNGSSDNGAAAQSPSISDLMPTTNAGTAIAGAQNLAQYICPMANQISGMVNNYLAQNNGNLPANENVQELAQLASSLSNAVHTVTQNNCPVATKRDLRNNYDSIIALIPREYVELKRQLSQDGYYEPVQSESQSDQPSQDGYYEPLQSEAQPDPQPYPSWFDATPPPWGMVDVTGGNKVGPVMNS
ncbi:hypothetical protein TRVA0_056S00716 [Trichomonascus vanleenenianus]|uniref:uncharacterized protein n=1 Tax=Trichomonascus vanleenenianus TaxID=2268995 RepID=UPI003EC99D79